MNQYEKIEIAGLGTCHVLEVTENGNLLYSEYNREHFILCMDLIEGHLVGTRYFDDLYFTMEVLNELNQNIRGKKTR